MRCSRIPGLPAQPSQATRRCVRSYSIRVCKSRTDGVTGTAFGRTIAAKLPRHCQQHRGFGAFIVAALAGSLPLVVAACGTGAAPAQSAIADVPGTVELNQTPFNDAPPGGGGTGTVDFHGK